MEISVQFKELNKTIDVEFKGKDSKDINADFDEFQQVTEYVGGKEYKGDYVAIPTTKEQVFQTKGMVLVDNMTVKEIPFFNVSNTSGGNTVYIASEV